MSKAVLQQALYSLVGSKKLMGVSSEPASKSSELMDGSKKLFDESSELSSESKKLSLMSSELSDVSSEVLQGQETSILVPEDQFGEEFRQSLTDVSQVDHSMSNSIAFRPWSVWRSRKYIPAGIPSRDSCFTDGAKLRTKRPCAS